MKKVEIWWHGPLTVDEIIKKHNDKAIDYGLYQIYGTHNISGPDTLLYIGRASERTFAKRVKEHDHQWAGWEASELQYFIGRLGGVKNVDDDEWGQQIDSAERLLIYYCAPPYNSQHIKGHGVQEDTIVLNFDKKNRLPLEVSTLYDNSKFWDEDDKWKEFKG